VCDVGVRTFEAADYLFKRWSVNEIRINQVMHGARFRWDGQSRPYKSLLPVCDASIAQQVDGCNLHDRILCRINASRLDVDAADSHRSYNQGPDIHRAPSLSDQISWRYRQNPAQA
jgi:hypothetical protein